MSEYARYRPLREEVQKKILDWDKGGGLVNLVCTRDYGEPEFAYVVQGQHMCALRKACPSLVIRGSSFYCGYNE